ncbi:ABC transporter permease [Oceanobacillus saliphilus]|uniref:ABC transporter permease n=1 Tax=Oceanobacillus saliphilus TaxID=2925834 RepID=UPI00201E28E5|nr:iron ABC transporter permease [Oceanobacillus saliphilus]
MKRLIKSGNWIYAIAFLALAILIIYPMIIIVYRSFTSENELSLQNYITVLTDASMYEVLWNSLFVSIISTIFSLIIGVALSWFVSRTDIKGKRWLTLGIMIPFLIPSFISAISWRQLLSPVGYLNKIYMELTGATEPFVSIYGPWGIIFVMTVSSFSLVFMITHTAFQNMDSSYEEAAQISGASRLRVMKDVTIPLIKPSILSSAVLVFVSNISNFGVPSILGFHESYFVLTTKIYQLLNDYTIRDSFSIAASLSMVLVLIAVIGIWLQYYLTNKKSYAVVTGKSSQKMIVNLGKYRVVITTLIGGLLFMISVAPVLAILATSLTKAYGLPPTLDNLTLENYRYILFEMPMAKRSLVNSLILAFGAATIAVGIGIVLAYFITKTNVKGRQAISFIVSLPYALPGTVIGLAIILAWIKPLPIFEVSIYNTLWIILVAYVMYYITLAVQTISSSLIQVHGSLEEAARISGASWLQNMRDIVLPLIKPGVISGWFLIFIPALSELTISILLWSSGNETIAVAVYNLQEQGNMTSASALSMVMIFLIIAGHQLSNWLSRRMNG